MTALAAIAVALVTFTAVTPASAGVDNNPVVISPGLSTTGGTATAADGTVRSFSSNEAASMLQPLLATMYYGQPSFADPPATAQRSSLKFDYVFTVDNPNTTGTFVVNYAQQGTAGWISLPVQALWPGSAVTADLADKWFGASPAFVSGFNGQGTVRTFSPATDTGTTKSSSDVSSVLIVVVIVGAVALIGGVFAITRRRKKA